MLSLPPSVRIFICTQPTDMRRSFDGLAGMVEELVGENPLSGHLFLFRNPDQLMLFDAAELEALAEEQQQESEDSPDATGNEKSRRRRRRQGHGRNRLPEHLPREHVIHELSEEERLCPCCGELRVEMGRETSEQLEYVPAAMKVIVHERIKYACRQCEEHVAIAAKPPQPIERGLPGPGLLAHTVLSKYGDHLPLYRQEDIFARYGVAIRRSTLCNWTASSADLAEPLYERMCRQVLRSAVVHTDDTSVKLLDASLGHARTARFWAYIGDKEHPYSVYDFTDSRARDGPAKFLDGFEGYLQADAYGGYDDALSPLLVGGPHNRFAACAPCVGLHRPVVSTRRPVARTDRSPAT